jgi:NAD(P)-dependent dehydrogenase (short-subunit alcohol dehydrogenase family)
MRLDGKVAIVTGAASGIGEATAKLFAREGAKVVLADIDRGNGTRVAAEIRTEAGQGVFVPTDVASEEQVRQMVETTVRTYGGVDVLVNNAGTYVTGKVHELTSEQWDQVMNVDLKGAFLCSKYVIPYMQKRGKGSIIMTSSVDGLVAEPDLPVYCAAKAGLLGLVRAMAEDYGPDNIRVNAICPGVIDTPLNVKYFNELPNPDQARHEYEAVHVLGRWGTTLEMAYCFLFLASDESSFVTGSSFVADGGMSTFINPHPAFKVG